MNKDKESKNKKKRMSDIICYICAVIFCIVPFLPFVYKMERTYDVVNGDLQQVSVVIAKLVLYKSWYGALPILVAVLVVISVLTKQNWVKILMSMVNVGVAAYFIVLANIKVAKIFEGELFEPAVGYYLEMIAAAFVLIITMTKLMNGSNEYDKVKQ